MAIDTKNVARVDLEDIFNECRRQSMLAIRPYQRKDKVLYDPDIYGISANEIKQVLEFALDGASKIADHCDLVKHHTETSLDALTYYEDYEDPTEASSYDEDELTITTPQGATDEPVANIQAMNHASGQKLTKEATQDTLTFTITDLSGTHLRYTIYQQNIRTALVNYVLYKWWALNSMSVLRDQYGSDWLSSLDDINHSSGKNHARKLIVRKTRPSV